MPQKISNQALCAELFPILDSHSMNSPSCCKVARFLNRQDERHAQGKQVDVGWRVAGRLAVDLHGDGTERFDVDLFATGIDDPFAEQMFPERGAQEMPECFGAVFYGDDAHV